MSNNTFFIPEELERIDWSLIEPQLQAINRETRSFSEIRTFGEKLEISPSILAVLLETQVLRERERTSLKPVDIFLKGRDMLSDVMFAAIERGSQGHNKLSFLPGNWGKLLSDYNSSLLGYGWLAGHAAICIQETNASMGIIAPAPTGGAAGVFPSSLYAVGKGKDIPLSRLVEAFFVGNLAGRIAFGRGPVSGSQAGCGAEIGTGAMMAAAGVTFLLGGLWDEIESAICLAVSPYMTLECSPTFGLVEWPCTPRNAHAAMWSIFSAELACAGVKAPYSADETIDRVFTVGPTLPTCLRETENGHWMETYMNEVKNKATVNEKKEVENVGH